MKHILLVSALFLAGTIAFGQSKVDNDPSYSVHNYKHPNKAAYAKKHKKDKSLTLTTNKTKSKENYKNQFSKPSESEKVVVKTRKEKTNKSYKHPYGL